jgi:Tfp pilus assembly protein PilF
MNKIFFLVLVFAVAMHAGAKSKQPLLNKKPIEISNETYVLAALDAQTRQKSDLASHYYDILYVKSGEKEYLYQSLRMMDMGNDVTKLSRATQEALSKNPQDTTLKRFAVIALLKDGKYSQAAQESLSLSNQTKAASDYLLLADSYLKMSNYQAAYGALKSAHDITYNEDTVERLSLIQYAHLGQKKEAIAFLKEQISVHGNTKVLGKRLGSFYADSGAFDDAALMYEQTYDLSLDPLIAQEAIKVYAYQQNIPKLNAMLEKSGVNDPVLLELYVRDKEFAKASELAKKLYKQDQNPLYLAQSSVFAYEAAANKKDPVLLNEVVEGLKRANSELESPLYLNYLGYLMIDHDIDVDGGMVYIKKALAAQPDSPFYIDSLAWGHYKKGECAEALKLIKQVESKLGSDEDEVRDHLKAIKSCKQKEK